MNTRQTRYPIVLMHGFGAMADAVKGGVFAPIAVRLREAGYDAHAPVVQPYACISERARTWNDHCRRLLGDGDYSALNLVAFSMGGLDARHLVSRLNGYRYVASVTTVSTPHHGTSLAARVLSFPAPLREAVVLPMRLAGQWRYPQWPALVEDALEELTPSYVRNTFNPATPDHETVTYFSYGAYAGKHAPHAANPVLLPNNRMLFADEGINDGFVSTRSARWGRYLGTLHADHAQLIGIPSPVSRFDADAFYLEVAQHLADAGF